MCPERVSTSTVFNMISMFKNFFLLTFRSAVRLALSNYSGAIDDARKALALAPEYAEAYLCQGDALLELEQFDSSEKSYLASIDMEPSIRRSKSFKARIENLRKKLLRPISYEMYLLNKGAI